MNKDDVCNTKTILKNSFLTVHAIIILIYENFCKCEIGYCISIRIYIAADSQTISTMLNI